MRTNPAVLDQGLYAEAIAFDAIYRVIIQLSLLTPTNSENIK